MPRNRTCRSSSFWSNLARLVGRGGAKGRDRRPLSLEKLDSRSLLSANNLGLISGRIYDDVTGDGITADDPTLPGVQIELYRDGGNGAFDNGGGDDAFMGSRVSGAAGRYAFGDLVAGVYYVQETAPTGFAQAANNGVSEIVIAEAAALGTPGITVDSFDVTQQSIVASSLGQRKATSAALANEAIGGERDLLVELTSQNGELGLSANAFGEKLLEFTASATAIGRRVVTWDGIDGNADQLDPTGLGGLDLTSQGTMSALRFVMGADQSNGSATIRIYTDATHWSQAIVTTPNTGGPATIEFDIPLASFVPQAGGGADMTRVGAVQFELSGIAAVDGQIESVAMVGPTRFVRHFANARQVDVNVTKTGSPDPVVPGNELVYSFTVANNGPRGATGVVLNDPLPSTVQFISATSSQGTVQHQNGNLVAGLGNLAVGQSASIIVHAKVAGSARGTITNTATVASQQIDVNPANNTATAQTGLSPQVDVAVVKSATPTAVIIGNDFTYTMTVSNNGPSDATGVVVTDPLPAGLAFQSALTSVGTVASANGTVTASVGNLAKGATATVVVNVTLVSASTPSITNTATVAATEPETNLANNKSSQTVQVVYPTSSIAGRVFVDSNENGLLDSTENGLAGVTVRLTGQTVVGTTVDMTVVTGADGRYKFANLVQGTYTVQETQPAGYVDGQDSPGSPRYGTALDDVFANIELLGGLDLIDYNFGEKVPPPIIVSHPPIVTKRRFLASSGA